MLYFNLKHYTDTVPQPHAARILQNPVLYLPKVPVHSFALSQVQKVKVQKSAQQLI